MARGRPVDALILTQEERGYLERQVRRHRVTCSLSERCRIVLRCADGVQSKQVAAELGICEHTVGKWRRRFAHNQIDGLLDEPRAGRPRSIDAKGCHALVDPLDGGGHRSFAYDDPAHVERVRAATPPGGDIQAVERSAVRRQGQGYRRPLSFAADPCHCLMCR